MQVRIIQEMSGLRDGKPWPAVGELIEVPDAEAADLYRAQAAEPPEIADQAKAEAEAQSAPRADVPEGKSK